MESKHLIVGVACCIAAAQLVVAAPPPAYDVVVVGGGVAGVAAALQSGRAGARTLLVERGFQIGGNRTTGGVNFPGLFHAWGRQVIDGCAYEVLTNAVALSGGTLPDFSVDPGRWHWKHQILVSIPVYVAVAEEALTRAGVTLLYHSAPESATRDGGIWRLGLSATGEKREFRAKVLVDCTGDGTLAMLAGGRRMRGETVSPGSFMYNFSNGEELWRRCDQKAVEEAFRQAVAAGELRREDAVGGIARVFRHPAGTSWNYVLGADTSTAEARTRANLEGRASMLRLYRFLRRQPGLEGLRLASCSPEVGVRETYRVEGDYEISEDDYASGRVFPDAVCNAFYPIDLHSEKGVAPRHLARGTVATVPFRALCAKGVENLLVAGRCLSADRMAASALRVQGTCMATGQAAGAAAALAAARNCDVRAVPIAELRAALRAGGAIVP